MNDPYRQAIKARIAAAQARNEARGGTSLIETASAKASEAKDGLTSFAKEHPIATVAGGVVAGVLIASLFPSARRQARMAGGRAAGFAALAGELALAYAAQAMDSAEHARRAGAEKLEDLGDSVGDTARSLRRTAGYRAANVADAARIVKRDTGKTILRAIGKR